MKAIVFVKEVAETPDGVSVTSDGQLSSGEGGAFLTDPIDPYSIETALQLKDKSGGEVIAITAGEPRAEKILKEALAMGADEAFLVHDEAASGSDPYATARLLAGAAKKSGDYDIIVVGERAADDNSYAIGPALGQHLDIPVLTYVNEVREFDPENKKIRVVRSIDGGSQVVEATLPAVITVVKGIHEPRYPSLMGIRKASKREVPVWSIADIGEEAERVGPSGSPTRMRSFDPPPPPSGCEMIEGTPEEVAEQLVGKIMDKKIL